MESTRRLWNLPLLILAAFLGLLLAPPGSEAETTTVIQVVDQPLNAYRANEPTPSAPLQETPEAVSPLSPPLASVPAATSGYDSSVRKALQEMALRTEHLDLWADLHPNSALRDLKTMSTGHQRTVANIVKYIRTHNTRIDPKTAWREAAALVRYSNKYGIPAPLATAVAHAESRFDPNAQSSKGALGVMQVMWRVHNGLLQSNGIETRKQMFDPEKGIAAGCLLLSRYIKAYGSVQKAINRYYGGMAVAYFHKVNRNMAKLVSQSAANGY